MSAIVVAGDTSGSVTLDAPAVAGTTVITLPSTSGTMALAGGAGSFTTVEASSTIKGGSTIAVGGATPSASGAGITFPATQSASTDANTLDDYEEGTWTPALKFGGGTTGISYKNTRGVYTKIGSVVTVHGFFELLSKGSSSGSATITLPFAPNTYGNPDEPGENGLANYYNNMASISGTIGLIIGNIGAACYFCNGGATGAPYLSETNFTNTGVVVFSATYRVA